MGVVAVALVVGLRKVCGAQVGAGSADLVRVVWGVVRWF